jgi:steroid delta-isomerase-like uncharacterized protein
VRERIVAANDATYAAWNAHDADAVAAIFAEDAEAYDVGVPEPVRGRAAIRERAAGLLVAFPDFHLERLELLVDGNANADRWRATGTHTGPFMGIAPTGNRIDVLGASFSLFGDDGLVVRDHHFWDVPTLLAQLNA